MPNPLTILITVHIRLNYPPSAEDSQICISSLILVPEIQIHRLAIWLSYRNFMFTMVSIYLLTCPITFRAIPLTPHRHLMICFTGNCVMSPVVKLSYLCKPIFKRSNRCTSHLSRKRNFLPFFKRACWYSMQITVSNAAS